MSYPTKFALVTAGSAGLGAAIAYELAVKCGMSVIINYNSNADRATTLVSTLRADTAGRRGAQVFHSIQGDLQDQTEVLRLVSETLALSGGRLDVVVSNYGWTCMTDLYDLEQGVAEADWDRCFQANVKSHLWLFHAARPALEAAEGVFISTASVAGVKPSGSSLAYAVTKAALIHLVKSLAVISAPNIRVNSVSPGVLLTDWGLSFPKEKLDLVRETNKLGRFATVEDVAAQVRALVESRSITGQNVVVDAGFSI